MDGHGVELAGLEPRRVCLIKPSSLGDVVHALPVLAALRGRWPGAHLAWVVNSGLRGLLEGHPLLDEVIVFERSKMRAGAKGVGALGRFGRELRGRGFDLAIDLQGLLRSGLMAWGTGAKVRVGLAGAREGATWFYTHRIPEPRPRRHAVDRLLAVAEALGGRVDTPRFEVVVSAGDVEWAERALGGLPRPRVVLNPGARWLTKRWPPEHFAEVGRLAHAHFGAGLVVVGAPEDRPLVDAVVGGLGGAPVVDLCGKTSLPQLAAVAAAAELFVSNDTGPLHLAAAAGGRVIGIYTCTRPEWTGPYGPNALVVRTRGQRRFSDGLSSVDSHAAQRSGIHRVALRRATDRGSQFVHPARGFNSDRNNWTAPAYMTYVVNAAALAVTEINYHPYDPTPVELAVNPAWEADDFEFLELKNVGSQSINLVGTQFDGFDLTLGNAELDAGQYGVVVRNAAAFASATGIRSTC